MFNFQFPFVILFLLTPIQLHAFCSELSTYLISTPSKPSVPWCVNEFDNTHTCSEWEIDSYYNDLERYRYDSQEFIEDLNRYVDEAVEYAQCRARELD